jgi:hypothetical protein
VVRIFFVIIFYLSYHFFSFVNIKKCFFRVIFYPNLKRIDGLGVLVEDSSAPVVWFSYFKHFTRNFGATSMFTIKHSSNEIYIKFSRFKIHFRY